MLFTAGGLRPAMPDRSVRKQRQIDSEASPPPEQVVMCAFSVSELEVIAEWGDWTGVVEGGGMETSERELLERIKRLAKGRP
jgi:hypothetical protein